jgi:hypothetical protein
VVCAPAVSDAMEMKSAARTATNVIKPSRRMGAPLQCSYFCSRHCTDVVMEKH